MATYDADPQQLAARTKVLEEVAKGVAADAAQAQQWYSVACALQTKAPGCDK